MSICLHVQALFLWMSSKSAREGVPGFALPLPDSKQGRSHRLAGVGRMGWFSWAVSPTTCFQIEGPRCRPKPQDTPPPRTVAAICCPSRCSITGFHGTKLNPMPLSSIA